MTFRQMIYKNTKKEPVKRFLELMAELDEWQQKVLAFQSEYAGRQAVINRDRITGVQRVIGIEDRGITPYGWSQHNRENFLRPRISDSGNKARQQLDRIGPSPSIVQVMVEAFDIPPYYKTVSEVFYPGFDLVNVVADDKGPEGWDPGETVDLVLFVSYNVWPEPPAEPWDGGDYFELSSMSYYYGLKGF